MAEEKERDITQTEDATGQELGGKEKGGDPTPSRTFTQAELDAIVKDRLEREKGKAEKAALKAREEAEQRALAEQGEFRKLAEKQAKQLAEMEPLAEQIKAVQAQLERCTAALTQYRDAQFSKIPDPIKVLLAKMDVVEQLDWLAQNSATLAANKPPITTASGGGKGNDEVAKKDREAEIRRRYRI